MRIGIVLLGLLLYAPAQAAVVKAQASAQVAETLAILAKSPLVFGYILPGSSAGTVTVTPFNKRFASGRVSLLPGLYDRATFLVRGTPHRSYTIHAPQRVEVTSARFLPFFLPTRANRVIEARDFVTYSENARAVTDTGRLSPSGRDVVYLGGTLVVPRDAAPGFYTALVPLTVSY